MCYENSMDGAHHARLDTSAAFVDVPQAGRKCGQLVPSENAATPMPDLLRDIVSPQNVSSPRRPITNEDLRNTITGLGAGPVCMPSGSMRECVDDGVVRDYVPQGPSPGSDASNQKCSYGSIEDRFLASFSEFIDKKIEERFKALSVTSRPQHRTKKVERDDPLPDYNAVRERSLSLLRECSFYHGSLTMDNARRRLKRSQVGSFLLRDSSDPNFIASLSIKTSRGTTSIRIAYKRGRFRLDCEESAHRKMPSFRCLLQLVEHYVEMGRADKAGRCVFLESSGRKDTPVLLTKPFMCQPPSLKHMARVRLNQMLSKEQMRKLLLFMPPEVETYVNAYPYTV